MAPIQKYEIYKTLPDFAAICFKSPEPITIKDQFEYFCGTFSPKISAFLIFGIKILGKIK